MNKTGLLYFFLLITLLKFNYFNGNCQSSNDGPIDEKLVLFTDRMIYVDGEKIFFSAFLLYPSNPNQSSISKIFYTELINIDGKKILGTKHLIKNTHGSGSMQIPSNIATGNYFVKAYTKYMRNWGPEFYCYVPIKIINPLKTKIYTNKDPLNKNSRIIKINLQNDQTLIKLSINKKAYHTREKVDVLLRSSNFKNDSIKGICITVVPESSISPDKILFPKNNQNFNEQFNPNTNEIIANGKLVDKQFKKKSSYKAANQIIKDDRKTSFNNLKLSELEFYPETRGISITGKLSGKKSDMNLGFKTLNLSLIGDDKVFMPVKTDSVGRFYFSLPNLYGNRDIYLNINGTNKEEVNILVDNDFCSKSVDLPVISFSLEGREKEIAYNFAVNRQIDFHFKKVAIIDSIKISQNPFYGEPNEILYLKNYIELPTLEEYFTELPSSVKIKKENGKKYFEIYNSKAITSIFKPLVLLDGVAINAPEKILAISPKNILRIEIVNVPYVIGDLYYAGIISIISKKADFAGINLPESGTLINYSFLAFNNNCYIQKASLQNHPDTRNTIFWQGKLDLANNSQNEFSFINSDTPGRYIVLLRGITYNGSIFYCSAKFEVKN